MIAQFGLERQLYSTAEGDEDLEVCVELLQGNITQRTFIGIGSGSIQSGQCKYHFHKTASRSEYIDSVAPLVCSSLRCFAFKHIHLDL